MSQWMKSPMGASGSMQVRAKLLVPSGAPDQVRCGEMFFPSQVWMEGIDWLCSKSLLLMSMAYPPLIRKRTLKQAPVMKTHFFLIRCLMALLILIVIPPLPLASISALHYFFAQVT